MGMFILEAPYVSPQLRDAAANAARLILDTAAARAALRGAPLVTDAAFAAAWHQDPAARLYTNSENALAWIAEHLADTPLVQQISSMKDKVRFREVMAEHDPEYRFQSIDASELDAFDPTSMAGPFVVKPAVGFFSLGVEIIGEPSDWPAAAARLQRAATRFRGLYPESVLDLERFVVEEVIEGDEFAVDAYYDESGQVTIINIYEHPFAHGADVSDRVYRVAPDVIERSHDIFENELRALGERAELRNVPIHVEYRINAAGRARPIEANPMRFGGWCAADITSHAWGYCPYRAFVESQRPDWSRLCEERRGRNTALIVADLPADLDRHRIEFIDYEAFTRRFNKVLELRRIEDPAQPVFAFLFVEVSDDERDQLDAILHADLTQYIRLEART
jgi:hypothetical protein